jgi:hypothetical protein
MALWSAHSSLLHIERLEVSFTPRLDFQSPRRRCGKSTGLKIVYLMSYAPRMAASITPSSLFRAVDAFHVSLFVDEADNVFKNATPDLLAIMNAGADRMTAKVMRTESVGDGKFESRGFDCFAALAMTSIKSVPDTLEDRCLVLQLTRATKGEKPERLTVRTRGPFIEIGRQFARWASDLKALPDPDMPADLFNRVEDKWWVCFQIAKLAGGDWPERCRKAALADLALMEAQDADGGPEGDLLADVWRVFYEKEQVEIFTKDLCRELIELSEAPWATAKRGQPIDEYYLRTHLRDFIPKNADDIAPRRWRDPNSQHEARAYHELHFQDAFQRYLGKGLPSKEPKSSPPAQTIPSSAPAKHPSHPPHPSQGGKKPAKSDTNDATDTPLASVAPSVAKAATPNAPHSAMDGATDGGQPSVSDNKELNQCARRKATDTTDATDLRQRSERDNSPSATGDGGDTGNPNSESVRPGARPNGSGGASSADFQYPRAGRGRGRSTPRKGATP